jgi:hypothetical protein
VRYLGRIRSSGFEGSAACHCALTCVSKADMTNEYDSTTKSHKRKVCCDALGSSLCTTVYGSFLAAAMVHRAIFANFLSLAVSRARCCPQTCSSSLRVSLHGDVVCVHEPSLRLRSPMLSASLRVYCSTRARQLSSEERSP